MPARRLVIAIVLCLLAGVVVSYATSWYAVCRFHEEDLDEVAGDRVDPAPEDWPIPPPEGWPTRGEMGADERRTMFAVTRRSGAFPLRLTTWYADWPGSSHQMHEVRSGWPAYSAATYECTHHGKMTSAWSPVETKLHPWYRGLHAFDHTYTRPFGPRVTYTQHVLLPLHPVWPGLAINSATYASVLFALTLTLGPLRRWSRRRRGLCEHCKYPLGASPVCTECGRPVADALGS